MNTNTKKRLGARAAGMLKQTTAKTFDRSRSKKFRSKVKCRGKDPRKGGSE